MLDVIVETSGALVHRRRHPGARSPSPPAARPPTSRPGWSPWAAGRGCSGRAPTPARATWSSSALDRPRRRGVGHHHRPHRRGGLAGHRRHPVDGLRPRRPELARRGALRAPGWTARTGCSSPATPCCARPTRSGSSRPPPWPGRTAPGSRVDLSSAAMVAELRRRPRSPTLCRALRPPVVFATDAEWATSPGAFGAGEQRGAGAQARRARRLVRLRGRRRRARRPTPGPVVDVTGAGDALAAGYLVGGADLAMARRGALRGPAGAPSPQPTRRVNGPLAFRGRRDPGRRAGVAVQPAPAAPAASR